MMKRNKFYRLTAAAVAFSILIPPSALAAAPSVQTDETVYINLDYYGSKIDTRVVKGVDLNGHRQFHDYGNYASVFNMSTFDEPDQSSPGIVKWNLEDEGLQRFYFECIPNDEAPIILPWDFDVSYKLNGVPVEAEQCAGASGLIEITVEVEPNQFASEYYQNNMALACVTGIDMSEALSIDAPGAQIQSMGTYKIVCFAGLPGQENTFTVRIGSECFESMGMMFFMAPLTLSALDILTDLKENVDDLKEIRDRFTDSNDQLYAGLTGFFSTADSLKGGLDILSGGITGINQVRKQMIESRKDVDPAIDTALTALEELAGNSDSIMPALQQLNTVLPTLNDTTGELLDAMRQTGGDIPRYQELLNVLYQDLTTLQGALDDFHSINHSSDDMIAFSDACEAIRLDMDVLSFQLMMMDGSLDNIGTIQNVINQELQKIRDKIKDKIPDKTPDKTPDETPDETPSETPDDKPNETPTLPGISDKLPGLTNKFPDLLDKITNIPNNKPDGTDTPPDASENNTTPSASDDNTTQIETQEIVNPIPNDEATESVSGSSSDGGDTSTSSGDSTTSDDNSSSPSDSATGGDNTSAPGDSTPGGDNPSTPGDSTTGSDNTSTPDDSTSSGDKPSTPGDSTTGGDNSSTPGDSTPGGDKPSTPGGSTPGGDKPSTPDDSTSSDAEHELAHTLWKLQQLWNDINATISNITGRISGVTSILSDMTQDTGSMADLLAVGESIGLNMAKILKTLEENETVADNFVVDGQEFSDLLSGTLSDISYVLDYLPDLSSNLTDLTNTTTNIIDETTNVTGSLRDSINTMLLTTEQVLSVSRDTLRSLRQQADESTQQSINGLLDVLQKTIASNNTSILQSASNSFHQAINDTNKDLDEMEEDLEEDTKFLNIDSAADIQSVTSLLNPAPSSLQFILRTKEISVEEVEEESETDSAAEDEGVMARIQNIFRKLYEAIAGVFVSE